MSDAEPSSGPPLTALPMGDGDEVSVIGDESIDMKQGLDHPQAALNPEMPTEAPQEEATFAVVLRDVRDRLDLRMRTGRYASGFAMELAAHMIARHYSVHAIFDEVGILEGADARPSTTKPATPFVRPPLVGLWHKHHHQAQFLPKNLLQELHRPGTVEAACAPHLGRTVEDAAGAIAYELVIGAYTRRAAENRVTGEFIVYELGPDGAHLYLTLGSHGDYAAIRSRVDTYKAFDQSKG